MEKVVAAMEAKDQLLFVYLRDSNAFYDGKRVLIDGSDLFLEYMRKKMTIRQTLSKKPLPK